VNRREGSAQDGRSGNVAGRGRAGRSPAVADFWPVLGDLTRSGNDVDQNGGDEDRNLGGFLTAGRAKIEVRGHPAGRVDTGQPAATTDQPWNTAPLRRK
jgi:hypothetical protein